MEIVQQEIKETKNIKETEGKLTLKPNEIPQKKTAEAIFKILNPESEDLKPPLKYSYSYRQYAALSEFPDEITFINKPNNPEEIIYKQKSIPDASADIQVRNEIEKPVPVKITRGERIKTITNRITSAAATVAAYENVTFEMMGPLMRKNRRGFKINRSGMEFKIDSDRMFRADGKKGPQLDQIEVEYKGDIKQLDDAQREQVQVLISEIRQQIQEGLESMGYEFESESPSKPQWVAQHFGLIPAL